MNRQHQRLSLSQTGSSDRAFEQVVQVANYLAHRLDYVDAERKALWSLVQGMNPRKVFPVDLAAGD